MASTTAGTASASMKWDEWFSEESDELVFVSLDRIQFRAGRKRIGSVSSVIKDMLSAHQPSGNGTSPPPNATTTPIELDYTARVVRVFLMKAYRMLPPQDPNWLFLSERYFDDYAEGVQVYNLLRYLDCPGLIEGTHSEMASAARKERKCRELLILASNNADVGLGTRAMCDFGPQELDTLYASVHDMNSYLDQLSPAWANFLRSKVIITDQNGEPKLRPQNESKWRLISMDFQYEVGVAEGRYMPRQRGLFGFGFSYAPSNSSSTTAAASASTFANDATTRSSTRLAYAPSATSSSSATAVMLQPPSVPAIITGFAFGHRSVPAPIGHNNVAPGLFGFGGPTTSALVPAGYYSVSAPTPGNVAPLGNGAFGFSGGPAGSGGQFWPDMPAYHVAHTIATPTATLGMPSVQYDAGNLGCLSHYLGYPPAFGPAFNAWGNNTATSAGFSYNAGNAPTGPIHVATAWGVFASPP